MANLPFLISKHIKNTTTLLLILIFCTSGYYSFAQLNGTYRIGKSGSADYPSFDKAIKALHNNTILGPVTFKVEPGTYNEQIYLDPIFGAGSGVYITFESLSGNNDDVIIEIDANDTALYTLCLDYSQFLIFRNLTFKALSDSAYVCQLINGSGNIYFLHNRFVAPSKSQLSLFLTETFPGLNNNNLIFKGNYFYNGKTGLILYGNKQMYETGNEVTGNTFSGQDSFALRVDYQMSPKIENNLIYGTGDGILLYGSNESYTINNNRIYLNPKRTSFGIRTYKSPGNPGTKALIANNMIYMSGTQSMLGIDETNCSDLGIYHNTILMSGKSNSNTGLSLTVGSYIDVKNNCIVNLANGFCVSNAYTTNVLIDYNNLYSNGSNLGNWSNKLASDLKSWQQLTGMSSHSISHNIAFCLDSNLHTLDSNLDNAGTPLSQVPKDLDGQSRDKTFPDIGADEFRTRMFSLPSDTAFCANETLTIYPPAGFDSYRWYDSSNYRVHHIIPAGKKQDSLVIWLDAYSETCRLRDSMNLLFYEAPEFNLGSDTSIMADSLLVLKVPSGYKKYHWFNNSDDSVLNYSKSIADTTEVWVEIETAYCKASDTIKVITIKPIDALDETALSLNIYPNPTSDYLIIENTSGKKLHVILTALNGKTVLEQSQSENMHLHVSDLAPAYYLLCIYPEDQEKIGRQYKIWIRR